MTADEKTEEKLEIEQANARRLVFEMMETAVALAVKKGPHPLETGCNCMACISKRKTLERGEMGPWKYVL